MTSLLIIGVWLIVAVVVSVLVAVSEEREAEEDGWAGTTLQSINQQLTNSRKSLIRIPGEKLPG